MQLSESSVLISSSMLSLTLSLGPINSIITFINILSCPVAASLTANYSQPIDRRLHMNVYLYVIDESSEDTKIATPITVYFTFYSEASTSTAFQSCRLCVYQVLLGLFTILTYMDSCT